MTIAVDLGRKDKKNQPTKVIILMSRVERKPDVAACEHQSADHPTNPRSLISAFVVRSLESIIDKLATYKISAF